MKDLNEITLLGNLGVDPIVKTFPDGNIVVRLSVATNRNYKDRDGQWQTVTEWHTVAVRGQAAERAAQLSKGNRVLVKGAIETRKYQASDGSQKYTTEVIIAGPGTFVADQTPRQHAMAQEASRPTSDPQAPPAAPATRAPSSDPFEDDIPF